MREYWMGGRTLRAIRELLQRFSPLRYAAAWGRILCKVRPAGEYSIMAEHEVATDGERPRPEDSGFSTRPSLLLRLRDPRDAAAWRTFVDVYGPLVYRHARRRGLRHEDAEDVTQRVFGRIAAAIRSFDYQPDLGRFRAWLGTVVRNEINSFLRQDKDAARAKGGDADPALENVAAPAADTEWTAEFNAHLLQVALERCRPHFEAPTWHAFERVWLEQTPAAQVAHEFRQPIDWVYVAKSRVLKQLVEEVRLLADDAALIAQATQSRGV
jgi:RNA polymerase sigma factor (sigma-70 family)